jgi:hypothetical protein
VSLLSQLLIATKDVNGEKEEIPPLLHQLNQLSHLLERLHCSQMSSATQLMLVKTPKIPCGPLALLPMMPLTAPSLKVATGLTVKN